MDENLKGAAMRGSDAMVTVLTERKDALEKENKFLKAMVAKYSEAARDRNDQARRVSELESELDHVSKPFLNLSRSVDGMNKDIEGMIGKMNSELANEVNTLQAQMERAVSKVKETEQLNERVREYEKLLAEQKEVHPCRCVNWFQPFFATSDDNCPRRPWKKRHLVGCPIRRHWKPA
eukprot:SAG31_NODE_4366_length_3307_cov_2.745636_5_plen_178_part_00